MFQFTTSKITQTARGYNYGGSEVMGGFFQNINCYMDVVLLVGGFNPSQKILVSWDEYSQYMENIIQMFQATHLGMVCTNYLW